MIKLKNGMSIFHEFYIIYVWLPIAVALIIGVVAFFKIRAEVRMCKIYYPEMNTFDCYLAPKYMPTKGMTK